MNLYIYIQYIYNVMGCFVASINLFPKSALQRELQRSKGSSHLHWCSWMEDTHWTSLWNSSAVCNNLFMFFQHWKCPLWVFYNVTLLWSISSWIHGFMMDGEWFRITQTISLQTLNCSVRLQRSPITDWQETSLFNFTHPISTAIEAIVATVIKHQQLCILAVRSSI